MKQKLYAVQDAVAGVYHPPFVAHSDGEAQRVLLQTALDERTALAQNPSDYFLVALGEYDPTFGVITSHGPRNIARIIDLLNQYRANVQAARIELDRAEAAKGGEDA